MMQQRLQTLYELHYDALLSFATISLQHSQMAEDIVQETFLLYMEQEDKQIATRKKRSLLSIFSCLLEREKGNDATYTIPYDDNLLSLTEEGISSTALSYFTNTERAQKRNMKLYFLHYVFCQNRNSFFLFMFLL